VSRQAITAGMGIRGAFAPGVRVPCQAVWKWQRLALSDLRHAILAAATLSCWLYVRVLRGFYDTSKVGLLVFLELWLRTYPLS